MGLRELFGTATIANKRGRANGVSVAQTMPAATALFPMASPQTLRLLAAILVLLVIGRAVKSYREQAHVEPLKPKVKRKG